MDLNAIYILIFAFGFDLIFGDPIKMPHLIVGYGNSISFFEKKLNKGRCKFLKGALLVMVLVGVSFVVPYLIIRRLNSSNYQIWLSYSQRLCCFTV